MKSAVFIITTSTAFFLAISISYNLGVFYPLDISIMSVLSLEEHLTSGITNSIFYFVIIIFISCLIFLYIEKLDLTFAEKEVLNTEISQKPPPMENSEHKGIRYLNKINLDKIKRRLFLTFLIILAVNIPNNIMFLGIVMIINLYYIQLTPYIIKISAVLLFTISGNEDFTISRGQIFIVVYLPILLLLSFQMGLHNTLDKINEYQDNQVQIQINDTKTTAAIIKIYSNGYVAIDNNNIYLRNNGTSFSYKKDINQIYQNFNISLVCKSFNLLCPNIINAINHKNP